MRIRSSGTSGALRRDCCATRNASANKPPTISRPATRASMPSVSTPTTSRPSATAHSSAPPRSKRRGCGSAAGALRRKAHSANAQIGTLTRNSHGQRAIDRMAAATDGPAAPEAATVNATQARPLAIFGRGWMRRTMAGTSAARNAPPAPCRNRNSTSQVNDGDSAHASDASPNATMPNA